MDKNTKTKSDNVFQDYRGVDINIADKNKNTTALRKQDTQIINNNPRNTEGPLTEQ